MWNGTFITADDYRLLLHNSHLPIRNGVVMSVSDVTDYKLNDLSVNFSSAALCPE
jgi:hypothetical protein